MIINIPHLNALLNRKQSWTFAWLFLEDVRCNKDFRNLIIDEFKGTNPKQDIATIRSMVNDADNINLPKKEILTVFHNVQELGMNLNAFFGDIYPISLSSLLSIIKSSPSLQLIRICLVHPGYYPHLRELYEISMELEAKYDNAGYSIHLEKNGKLYGDGIYCIIKKKFDFW